jgi:NAD(P)-dependent dehydrogenase (short-subunit alcohol dehydrogenase family)
MKEGCHVVIVSETEQDFGPGVLTVICREKQFEKIGASFEKAVESLEIVHVLLNLYTFSAGVDFISVAPEIWRNEIEKVFGMAFFSLKAVYHGLVSCKGSGCFMTVSNIGGNFGLETIKYDNLSAGINTGMVKAMAKEIKSLYCKTIDFDDVSDTKFIVDTIFKEMCVPDGVTEVSYVEKQRKSLRLIPQILPFPEQEVKKISLNEEDILLFVGGGRGIVTAFVKEILKRYHSTVIIIGRSKEPEDEEWAKMSPQEFWDYKTKYIKGMKIQHKSMPVIEIVNSYEDMQNRRKLAENIREFRKISDKVHYFSCDVSDTQEVVELENTIRNLFGGITGIINGAGILTVGRIPQKRGEQALKAIFVRGMGLYNLYYAFAQHPLKFIQNIGSIAGRFGMDGQCDYVVSCDLAAKMCRKINQIQTEYDCYTMEWTAWEELGMAALPEIQNIQRSRGLSYISVKEGVEKFLQEITYGGKEEEVVIFSSLGEQASDSYQLSALTKDMSKLSSVTDANGYVIDCKKYPFLDRVLGHSNSKLTIEKNLDLKNDLYLRNHMVAGDYVFPAVAHIELYCEMAVLLSEIKSETWYIYEICKIDLKNFIKYFPKNELKLKATMEIVQQDLE